MSPRLIRYLVAQLEAGFENSEFDTYFSEVDLVSEEEYLILRREAEDFINWLRYSGDILDGKTEDSDDDFGIYGFSDPENSL